MPTLEFKGKQFVYSHHLSVPFRELKIDSEKSLPKSGSKPSLDDNLIIHGDNLEGLKALLPTHAGKVDCIFIDPPYNTGNEGWCYNDNVRSPLMQEWLKKAANPVDKEDLERHDKWLCMMWPRLHLLNELLKDNGLLFVSIDDNEYHELICLMNEIFGEECYVGTILWKKKTNGNNVGEIPAVHDYIACYCKRSEQVSLLGAKMTEDYIDKKFSNPDADPRGLWDTMDLSANHEGPYFPIVNPNTGVEYFPPKGRYWVFNEEEVNKRIADGRIIFGKKGITAPVQKVFLSEKSLRLKVESWWDSHGLNSDGMSELGDILGKRKVFDHPKPSKLIKHILDVSVGKDAIILDSFAGSGTTAHATLKLNQEDGGTRKFILVECEDYADQLTAERVRRVIAGYPFMGTHKEELLREKLTWSVLSKKSQKILESVEKIENERVGDFDKIKKEIKDGVLTVTGERKVSEFAEGTGGSFTYCTLGEAIQVDSLLTGEGMPSFEALARYVFYTATGQSLDVVAKRSVDGFIGETDLFRIHLFYQPEVEWLRSNEAALNSEKVEAIKAGSNSKKRTVVFAVAKFMSQKELTKSRIEFCQLPYAVHRIMGS